MARIVVALGGNALGNSPKEQQKLVAEAAKSLIDIVENGDELIISHGNGPQVGAINLGMSIANSQDEKIPEIPLPESTAMSQGYIGFHIQQAISNELKNRGIEKEVVSLVTQVEVKKNDLAFSKPSKPIGKYYSKSEAQIIAKEKGWSIIEDAGRGWRRVVGSPKPIDFIESFSIKLLVNEGVIVIAGGGGGIPIYKENGKIFEIPAVIDKDFASEKLAELVNADKFIVLTAVENAKINFGTPEQENLELVTIDEMQQHIKNGQFAPGSMLPKVEAAMLFAEFGGESIITSLEKAKAGIEGLTGTRIKK